MKKQLSLILIILIIAFSGLKAQTDTSFGADKLAAKSNNMYTRIANTHKAITIGNETIAKNGITAEAVYLIGGSTSISGTPNVKVGGFDTLSYQLSFVNLTNYADTITIGGQWDLITAYLWNDSLSARDTVKIYDEISRGTLIPVGLTNLNTGSVCTSIIADILTPANYGLNGYNFNKLIFKINSGGNFLYTTNPKVDIKLIRK
jgi:hypothetical protein